MGMKCCSVFAVPVWLSEALGMHLSPHLRRRINLQHLSAECQNLVGSPPTLVGSVLLYGPKKSPSLQPPHQRGEELPTASPWQFKCSSLCPTC